MYVKLLYVGFVILKNDREKYDQKDKKIEQLISPFPPVNHSDIIVYLVYRITYNCVTFFSVHQIKYVKLNDQVKRLFQAKDTLFNHSS